MNVINRISKILTAGVNPIIQREAFDCIQKHEIAMIYPAVPVADLPFTIVCKNGSVIGFISGSKVISIYTPKAPVNSLLFELLPNSRDYFLASEIEDEVATFLMRA